MKRVVCIFYSCFFFTLLITIHVVSEMFTVLIVCSDIMLSLLLIVDVNVCVGISDSMCLYQKQNIGILKKKGIDTQLFFMSYILLE